MDARHYDLLAAVFAHPTEAYLADVARAGSMLEEHHPAAHAKFERFRAGLPAGDPRVLAELHARTFVVQPITTLDVGYLLFGEDYKRGEVLANLNREHREAGVDCGDELADHLSNVLRLLPRLEDRELREDLVRILLMPALEQMVGEFLPERLKQSDLMYAKHHRTVLDTAGAARTVYRGALEALQQVLRDDFEVDGAMVGGRRSEFVLAVGNEMTIEDGPCSSCS